MMIRPYCKTDREEWLRLRLKLWPFLAADEHLPDMDAWLARPDTIVLVAPRRPSHGLAGFAEVGTRSTAEWCETSPVAYLEGWYVEADARRQGIGAALVLAAENWAREHGFREFASDTQIDNTISQRAHLALGFTEVERLVAYRKIL